MESIVTTALPSSLASAVTATPLKQRRSSSICLLDCWFHLCTASYALSSGAVAMKVLNSRTSTLSALLTGGRLPLASTRTSRKSRSMLTPWSMAACLMSKPVTIGSSTWTGFLLTEISKGLSSRSASWTS